MMLKLLKVASLVQVTLSEKSSQLHKSEPQGVPAFEISR